MDNDYQTQPQDQTQQQNVQPVGYPPVPEVSDLNYSVAPEQSVPQTDDLIANMSNEEIIANFAKGLLIEKNLGEMDENTKKDMVQDLIERINDFINRAILEKLPKEKLDELDNMIENDAANPDAVTKLIQDSGIDASAAAVEAMEKFREVYLGTDVEQEA